MGAPTVGLAVGPGYVVTVAVGATTVWEGRVTGVAVGGKMIAVGVGGNVIAVGVGGNTTAVGVGGNVIEVGVGAADVQATAATSAARIAAKVRPLRRLTPMFNLSTSPPGFLAPVRKGRARIVAGSILYRNCQNFTCQICTAQTRAIFQASNTLRHTSSVHRQPVRWAAPLRRAM